MDYQNNKSKKFTLRGFIKKNYFSQLYALFVSTTVFFSYITLNFEYHRFISPWTELTKLTHGQLFNEIIISVFKPFLHIEKISGEICGYECVYFANKIAWVLLIFLITFLIAERLKDYFISGSSKLLRYLTFLIAITYPFLIRWASWGTIVDPIYALGIFLLIIASREFLINKNKSISIKKYPIKTITCAVIGIFLVDLSRPYGFLIICLFSILCVDTISFT